MNLHELCAALLKRQEERGVTKIWLCKQTGLSDNHVSRLLHGKLENPSLDSIVKIAKHLGLAVTFDISDK